MGPLPKPTAVKIAEGNPGKQKLPAKEPKVAAVTDITPPDFLSQDAVKIWTATAPELVNAGLLTKADVYTFAKYCDSEALYWRFRRECDQEEWVFVSMNKVQQEYRQVNAKAMLMHQAFQRAEKLAHHFGLSPAARARLGRLLEDDSDELDDFIAAKPKS